LRGAAAARAGAGAQTARTGRDELFSIVDIAGFSIIRFVNFAIFQKWRPAVHCRRVADSFRAAVALFRQKWSAIQPPRGEGVVGARTTSRLLRQDGEDENAVTMGGRGLRHGLSGHEE